MISNLHRSFELYYEFWGTEQALEYFWKHGSQGSEVGKSGQCFLKLIFEMLNTYMNGSLIYKSAGIALVGEKRGAIGARLGVMVMQRV